MVVQQHQQRSTSVLVVDDSDDSRLLIRALFEGPRCRVLEGTDGHDAIALAQAERPDCILLDLNMPRMDGFAALEELARDPRTRAIPVIMVTASDYRIELMDRALRAGAVDYITKPIDPNHVVVRVRGAIERRRLLEELENLRSSFTSMLVHDLRAPLTVVRGYAELLRAGANGQWSEPQRQYVHSILDSCNQMLGLIAEILDLSRLEAGKLTLQRRPCDLAGLIRELAERLSPIADRKGVQLEAKVPDGLEPLPVDPVRIEQVLMNLLSNALKFTPRRGAITVELAELDDQVEIGVTDTGPGIAAHEMPLLFERFSQLSAASATDSPGTGLGLVICRHLVEAHGGTIRAESEPGRGSRFVVRLPRRTEA